MEPIKVERIVLSVRLIAEQSHAENGGEQSTRKILLLFHVSLSLSLSLSLFSTFYRHQSFPRRNNVL